MLPIRLAKARGVFSTRIQRLSELLAVRMAGRARRVHEVHQITPRSELLSEAEELYFYATTIQLCGAVFLLFFVWRISIFFS